MLIYAGTKSDFMIDTENDCLETKLYENIKLKMNRTTGLSELNAWRNSLKEMYITLNDSDIPKDAGVAIEYNIPQTSKRVDFLISGYGWNGKGNVVIVELKQWEMEAIVLEKNRARNRARILAGYCWNWPKATRNNTNFHDIEIGDYSISWNLNGGDAFAISEESVHEAGCIHTSQGLEFDYTGVIIGDDMRFENGKVITDYTKRAKTDNSLKGIKTLAKKDKEKADQVADEIIKNTYRTLMTRGMKGCYVYCTDTALAEYLKKLLKQTFIIKIVA